MQKRCRLPGLLSVLAGLAACLGFVLRTQANLDGYETDLAPTGAAYEINADSLGLFWISDFDAGQVWGLYPDEGYFEVYTVSGFPIDARHEGEYLWWADGVSDILGRVSTLDGAYSQWQVPGATGFYGTALDAEGRFWVVDAYASLLYRLAPDQTELCTFTLPSDGISTYIIRDAGYLWLGDQMNGRLLRLSTSNNNLDWWSLPEDSAPFGMAFDGQGNVWYSDANLNSLAQLNLSANKLVSYSLPLGNLPTMITVFRGQVWFTEPYEGNLGRLDPQTASYTEFTPEAGSTVLEPECTDIDPSSSGYLTITIEDAAWTSGTYAQVLNENGWYIYQLPEDSSPWGVTGTDAIWFVDTNRQVLGKIPPPPVQITACKEEDLDGDVLTTADRVALGDWMIYLTVDGVRQEPGQLTGPDGCTLWNDLTPGDVYGLEEELPSGWQALTPATHSFGVAEPGAQLSHTFVNAQTTQKVYLPLITR